MRFFSGFSFQNEEYLFEQYLNKSEFSISGFSFGSILAFEYALNSKNRIDTLQLFSPAFFQNQPKKFLRTQLIHFKKDEHRYIENFVANAFFPNFKDTKVQIKNGKYSELEKLLNFQWQKSDLETIIKKGIKIEVFLGNRDKIIDSNSAFEFFREFAEVCLIKNVGHTLSS